MNSLKLDKSVSDYQKMLSNVKPKITTFRSATKDDLMKKRKFEEEEKVRYEDLVLFDKKAGMHKKSNNMLMIKMQVEEKIKENDGEKQNQKANSDEDGV